MGQEFLDPLGSEAWDVGQAGAFHSLTTLLTVEAHRESVGLIAQTAQELNPELLGFTL